MLLSVVMHVHAIDDKQERLYERVHRAIQVRAPLETIQELVKHIADLNIQNEYGNTLCHHAIKNYRVDALEMFIKDGANPNTINIVECTPLHDACAYGSLNAVQALLKCGADTHVKNMWGKTPLEVARDKDHKAIVKLIEEYEATLDIKEPERN